MLNIQIKKGIVLTDIVTKKTKKIEKVDLKGVYFDHSQTPVPLTVVVSKIKDKLLVKA